MFSIKFNVITVTAWVWRNATKLKYLANLIKKQLRNQKKPVMLNEHSDSQKPTYVRRSAYLQNDDLSWLPLVKHVQLMLWTQTSIKVLSDRTKPDWSEFQKLRRSTQKISSCWIVWLNTLNCCAVLLKQLLANSEKFQISMNQYYVIRCNHTSLPQFEALKAAVNFHYNLHKHTHAYVGGVSRSSCSRSVWRGNHTRFQNNSPTKTRTQAVDTSKTPPMLLLLPPLTRETATVAILA